jgi:phospholipase/carboxylesterase
MKSAKFLSVTTRTSIFFVFLLFTLHTSLADKPATNSIEELLGIYNRAVKELMTSNYQEAVALLQTLHKSVPDNFMVNYNLACALARTGKYPEALKHLEKAVDSGFVDVNHIETDPDIDPLRQFPEYKAIIEKAKQAGLKRAEELARIPEPESVFLPSANKDEKMPLLIFLHGMGGCAEDLKPLFLPVTKSLKWNVLLPCGGVKLGFKLRPDGRPAYTWNLETDSQRIIDEIKTISSSVNTNEIYIAGFSAGAKMAYNLGFSYPEIFSGIIAFSGGITQLPSDEKRKEAVKRLPVFIVHGENDNIAQFAAGQRSYEVLKKLGFKVQLKAFKGGHAIPKDYVEILKNAIEWMRTQKNSSG